MRPTSRERLWKIAFVKSDLHQKGFFPAHIGLFGRAEKLGSYFYDTSCGSEPAGRPVEGVSYTETAWRNCIHLIIHERRVKDKVSTWGSLLKDCVKMLCRNSHWSDGFWSSFLTARQTQQTDLMFLFRLKMDRRFKTVQHERIKGKTVSLVLISPLQETQTWAVVIRPHRSQRWNVFAKPNRGQS